jgi:hypothetical protein
MQGFRINIGKALRHFCKSVIGASVPNSDELHEACWMSIAYPDALSALVKIGLRQEIADSYICGYWRGLRDAKYLLQQKSKKRKSGAVKPS